jgi:hypothetical protein
MPDVFPTPAPVKPDFKSKTWWFNLVIVLVNAALAYLGVVDYSPDLPMVVGATSVATASAVGSFFSWPSLIAIVNLLLRYSTTKPVSFLLSEK